jgi:hypothetical protein
MPSSSKPLPAAVVPCRCIAMTVALEVVAEHRRIRAQADIKDEAELANQRRNAGKKARR